GGCAAPPRTAFAAAHWDWLGVTPAKYLAEAPDEPAETSLGFSPKRRERPQFLPARFPGGILTRFVCRDGCSGISCLESQDVPKQRRICLSRFRKTQAGPRFRKAGAVQIPKREGMLGRLSHSCQMWLPHPTACGCRTLE